MVSIYTQSNEDTYVLSEKLAYDNEVCISVFNEDNVTFNYNTMQNGCMLKDRNKTLNKIINNFISSKDISNYYQIFNPLTRTNGILYAIKTNNKNVFIYSNLESASNFVRVFKGQLIYFVFLMIGCSVLISLFIAKKTTKPIKEITKKAKNIGLEKYDNKFPKNGVLEIEELSQTLEEVQRELKKSDEIKRDLMANVSHDLKTPY